ncbi:PDxFFG protein [Mycoplasma sp. Pen4]|nr:PDxFFG protein [Mycoplasma sp. Pen4]
MQNVAWGPDLLTLDSFRIVKGVEQNGNAITLGSHSTAHKETSEIKFFPDAFFGSLPIFSNNAGRGNAEDALTFSAFGKDATYQELLNYLDSLPTASVLKNEAVFPSNDAFGSIQIPRKLLNKKFKVYKQVIGTSEKVFVLPDNIEQSQLKEFGNKYGIDLSSLDLKLFKELTVTNVVSNRATRENQDSTITVTLANRTDETSIVLLHFNLSELEDFANADFDSTKFLSYQVLCDASKQTFRSFLDLHDLDGYLDERIFVYAGNFYASFVEAIDKNAELQGLSYEEQKELVQQYKVVSFEVTNKKEINTHILEVGLENIETQEKIYEYFKASKYNDFNPKHFDEFKDAIGYQGAITPLVLTNTPEDPTAKDKNGNPAEGLAKRHYQVYNEAYDGLIKKVLKKYPHLNRGNLRNGPHFVKYVDENGITRYKVEDGSYYGFSATDRIGLPLVLGALVPGFNGIPTDFLRYVATHEYGHHLTLDQGQAWEDKYNPILVGGLSTRAGASDSSYYSYSALKNYLDARTNLEIERVNALGHIDPEDGKFIRFKFGKIGSDGLVSSYERENIKDIWGSENPRASIYEVLKNNKRRFLQDYNGMVEAAKARNVALGDLFIANSFDSDSGTLNPQIIGVSKVFKKEIDPATNQVTYKFNEVNARNVLGQLKDGQGNPITNSVTFTDDNTFRINVVETALIDNPNAKPNPDGTRPKVEVYTKVNLLTKDGKPVINVPLNVPLDEESKTYINNKIAVITRAFEGVIDRNLFDSGWNNATTSLGGSVNAKFRSLLDENIDESIIYRDIYKRSGINEINPHANNIDEQAENDPREAFAYFALSSNSLRAYHDLVDDVLSTFQSLNRGFGPHGFGKQYANVNKTLVLRTANPNDNDVLKLKRFAFPNIQTSPFLRNMYVDFNIKAIGEAYNIPVTNAKVQGSLSNSFAYVYGVLGAENRNIFQSQPFAYISSLNEIIPYDYAALATVANRGIKEWNANVKGIAINPFFFEFLTPSKDELASSSESAKAKQLNSNLLKIVNSSLLTQVFLPQNPTNKPTVLAKDFDSFFDFVSIDYSKAIYDETSKTYNWDIEYVKSKFDFIKARQLFLASNDLTNEEKQAITFDDQKLANILMRQFRKSGLFSAVKDFSPATDLVANRAIFSSEYGISVSSPEFTKYYNDAPTDQLEGLQFNAEKLQNYFAARVAAYNQGHDEAAKYMTVNDMLFAIGEIQYAADRGKDFDARTNRGVINMVYSIWNSGEPSSDAQTYNATRIEPLLNDKFTDYIYSIAETLTRDYVQVTYVPDSKDFGNVPNFISGLTEANTGLDFVVDGTELEFLNHKVGNHENISKSIDGAVESKLKQEFYAKALKIRDKYQLQIDTVKDKRDALIEQLKKENITDAEKATLEEELNKQKDLLTQFITNVDKEITALKKEYAFDWSDDITYFRSGAQRRRSNYFGNFLSNNNGFFKDRWEKETIGMLLYDDERNPIIDNNIRLLDFDGNKINSRPKAFFVSQMLNYGVGSRTISGIFRNKNLDALALYGYMPNELAEKVKYIKFTDVVTKEEKYLPINVQDTNNLFYLEKQGDVTSKVTLKDLGYSSWISDYGLMSKYRDTLLEPKHEYYVEFVDANKNTVDGFTIGDLKFVAENGKNKESAPVYIENEDATETNNGNSPKPKIKINFQFNISH